MPLVRDNSTVRIEMPDGDWYELRRYLGHYHRNRLSQMTAITVHIPTEQLSSGRVDVFSGSRTMPATLDGLPDVQNARLHAYIVRWSHVEDNDRPTRITLETCKLIPPVHAERLLAEIQKLQTEQDGPTADSPLDKKSNGSSTRLSPGTEKGLPLPPAEQSVNEE